MIVYIEWVIADNLALDLLLAYLTRLLLKQKPTWWRVLFSAAVGTALVFPFLYIEPTWARVLYKVAVLVAVCLPLADSVRLLRKSLVVYAGLSVLVGGVYYLATDTHIDPAAGVLTTSGGKVALVASSVLVATYLVRQVRGIAREIAHKRHMVRVQLQCGEHFVFVSGLYDSGNTVLAPNGRGIIFLSPKIADVIVARKTDSIVEVRTVQGSNLFDLYQIERVKIYCDGSVNTIEQVNVAYARDNLSGCDALLPYHL